MLRCSPFTPPVLASPAHDWQEPAPCPGHQDSPPQKTPAVRVSLGGRHTELRKVKFARRSASPRQRELRHESDHQTSPGPMTKYSLVSSAVSEQWVWRTVEHPRANHAKHNPGQRPAPGHGGVVARLGFFAHSALPDSVTQYSCYYIRTP